MQDTNRPRGILSTADRKYLLGESDIEKSSQQERNTRSRIRERVRNGLMDFHLLADDEYLEDRDLQQIRELTDDGGEVVTELFARFGDENLDEPNREPVLDPDIEEGLVEAVAFVFRVKPNSGYFEQVVRAGLQRGVKRVHPAAEVTDVTVSVSDPETIAQQAEGLIEQGVPLTETEIRVALERDVRSPDEIAHHVQEYGTREEAASRSAILEIEGQPTSEKIEFLIGEPSVDEDASDEDSEEDEE